MPNMANAKKKVKQDAKRKIENNNFKSSMRTAMKNVEKAVAAKEKEKATEELKVVIKRLDKANAKGVVTKNFVARNKSRLTEKVNAIN